MDALDAIWHLLNFGYPALALGVLSASFAKLLWRRELAGARWARLARDAVIVCAVVLVAGLVISGRDGRMSTYGAMVAACALTLWWRGFGPGRR